MTAHSPSPAPDVIMIGAAKVGSTSVYEYLKDHPGVCLSQAKELYYFLPPAERTALKPWGAIDDAETYQTQFAHRQPEQVTVELSTNYYAYPEAAAIMQREVPNAKLFMIVRDPANRAFSSYNMRLRDVGDVRPVEMELTDPQSRFVQRGLYGQQLAAFYEQFPPEQIKVLFFEDFRADKLKFFQTLCDFIEVEFIPPARQYHGRPGGVPKKQWLHRLVTQHNPVRKALATMLKPILNTEKRQQLRERLVKSNIQKTKLSPELRQQLVKLYEPDIIQLESLLNVDLSHWKRI